MGIEDAHIMQGNEQGRSEERSFFERHQDGLREFFDIVVVPKEASHSIPAAVNATQPWVKGDHSRPQYVYIPDDEAAGQRLHELYADFGLANEVSIPPGHYNRIVIPGAVQLGNLRRNGLVGRAILSGGVTADIIDLLGGQRRVFPERELDDIGASMHKLEQSPDPWLATLHQRDLSTLWETDGIRLAALDQLGPMALRRINLRFNQPARPEGFEPLRSYEFDWQGIAVRLMHSLAVDRPNGDRRHTTESCFKDWLVESEPAQNETIVFIGANPHLERMTRVVQDVLHRQGREDLRLVYAGSAAPPGLGHSHFHGEIARNLYQDWLDARRATS